MPVLAGMARDAYVAAPIEFPEIHPIGGQRLADRTLYAM